MQTPIHTGQLPLPLSPLAPSHGMSSDVISLTNRRTGRAEYAGWLRKAVATTSVMYAGFYSTCTPPAFGEPRVKVAFPLPSGSAKVILRPKNGDDRSVRLISAGRGFGDSGYYRIHRLSQQQARVKYLPPCRFRLLLCFPHRGRRHLGDPLRDILPERGKLVGCQLTLCHFEQNGLLPANAALQGLADLLHRRAADAHAGVVAHRLQQRVDA